MQKLKTVKEVCEETKLSRKLLHDYDEQNIVKPSKYKNMGYVDRDGKEYDGYKLYDETAVFKLKQIAIFRKLGLSRSEIKKRITAFDYDSNKVLEEQITMLKKKKEEIENLIIVAEQMRLIGMKSSLVGYYAKANVMDIIQNQKRWESSSYYRELDSIFEQLPEEFEKEIEPIIEELLRFEENAHDSLEAMNLSKNLFEIFIKYYGLMGWFMVMVLAFSVQGEGQLAKEVGDDLQESIPKSFSKAIINYAVHDIDAFWNEFVDVIIEFFDVVGSEYETIRVKEMVEELQITIAKHFGVRNKMEYEIFFDFILTEQYSNRHKSFRYAVDALKHYCM